MEENSNGGYTAEGRKLRPRRPRVSGKVYSSTEGSAERRRTYRSSEEENSGSYKRRSYSSQHYGQSENHGYSHSDRRGNDSYGRNYGRQEGYYGRRSGSYGDSERETGEGRDYGSYDRRSGGYGNSDRRGYGSGDSRRSGYVRQNGRNFGQSGRKAGFVNQDSRDFGTSGRRIGSGENEGHFSKQAGRKQYAAKGNDRGRNLNGVRKGAPARAKKSTAKPNPYRFSETDEQSMNLMLSRKPQLDQIQISDNDYVQPPVKDTIRLNKFIANSGICSRREADQYIQAGVVTVNDEVVTELGTKVNVFTDDIKFNGERIRGEEKVYIVMNKPKGFVTSASDPHAEKTVMDLLKKCSARVFPVGRLDKSTTGVLMFTNDGEIAEKLTHPSYDKKKIYQVILEKPITQEDFDKVLNGITLSDGDIKADELEYLDPEDHRKLGIEIHSGKNRIVRRIFESAGYDVKALDRVYFAGLTKKGLKKGEWRYLSEGEVNVLKMGAYA